MNERKRRRPYFITVAGAILLLAPILYVLSIGPMQIVGAERYGCSHVDPVTGDCWEFASQQGPAWIGPWRAIYKPLHEAADRYSVTRDLLDRYYALFDPWVRRNTCIVYEAPPPGWQAHALANLGVSIE